MVDKSSEDQLLERHGLIEKFAAGMTHDLNNIISAIAGYTELTLTTESLPPDIRSNLERIQEASNAAADFIHDISIISGRGIEARCLHIDICATLRESLGLIKKGLPANIELEMNIPDKSTEAFIEPGLLQQLLFRLCTNAVQAMPEGGLLGVEYGLYDGDQFLPATEGGQKQLLRLRITDTGVGISPEVSPYIFDPYFTTRRRGEGKGLGLAIVQGIVIGCGGKITVESEPGKGSCFNIFFTS